jgi:hypothetical protein
MFLGMYFADVISGIVHIYFDNRKVFENTKDMNFITNGLNNIAYGFKYGHHKSPLKLTENVIITAIHGQFEILLFLTTPVYFITNYYFTNNHILVFTNTAILLSTSSQIFHGYSHLPTTQVPYIVKILQRYNLILSNKTHLQHHKHGEYYFTIVNGWANPLMDVLYKHIFKPIMKSFPNHFETVE